MPTPPCRQSRAEGWQAPCPPALPASLPPASLPSSGSPCLPASLCFPLPLWLGKAGVLACTPPSLQPEVSKPLACYKMCVVHATARRADANWCGCVRVRVVPWWQVTRSTRCGRRRAVASHHQPAAAAALRLVQQRRRRRPPQQRRRRCTLSCRSCWCLCSSACPGGCCAVVAAATSRPPQRHSSWGACAHAHAVRYSTGRGAGRPRLQPVWPRRVHACRPAVHKSVAHTHAWASGALRDGACMRSMHALS